MKWIYFWTLGLLAYVIARGKENEDLGDEILLLRKLSTGYIRGRQLVTAAGVEGFAFQSIPIAEPPVGELRFRRPIPRKPWDGVLDATNYTSSCYWNSTITTVFTSAYNMSEDCIHTNVFTSRYCLIKGNCAVVLYIHGGEFAFGSPLQLNPPFLVDNFNNVTRNVVFVSAGFRAAAFGVLNLNWKLKLSADLNPALHDIVHALQWIQREIYIFGGNNNKVTLMGHSGGARIVDYLSISPYAQKFFHQVVIMSESGSGETELVPDRNQAASRRLANKVGCTTMGPDDEAWEDTPTVEDIVQCLRNKSAAKLSAQQPLGEAEGIYFGGSCLDYGEHALLPSLYNVLEKNRAPIPVLTGTVSKEWLDSRNTVINGLDVDQFWLRYWCNRLVQTEGYNATESLILLCMNEYNTTSKSIFIFDDQSTYSMEIDLVNSFVSRNDKVYLYQFEYEDIGDAYSAGEGLPNPAKEAFPGHSHELIYLIGQHLGNFTPKDYQIKYLYSQIFVDFINTGTPNTKHRKWDKYTPEKLNYFVIDFPDPTLENPGMKNGYHEEAYDFWHVTLPKYGGKKYLPLSEKEARTIINGIPGLEDPVLANITASTTMTPDTGPFSKKTNWQLMFWIAFGAMLILAIILCCTCMVAKKRRNNYETL